MNNVLTKEIQTKILEIFVEIEKICIKHNLQYFAIGGSCLGAVRHQGFIPWDDDLDIAMPRTDYEKFKRIAEAELPVNMKLFTENQGKHYKCYFLKVHNINTTFIERNGSHFPDRYTGVYVDIMPLDGIPNGKIQRKLFTETLKILARCDATQKYTFDDLNMKNSSLAKKIGWECLRFFTKKVSVNYYSKKYVKLQRKVDYETADYTAYLWSKRASKVIFPKQIFEDYEVFSFENISIRCPKGYDEFLTILFGDYMKLPPEEERIPCHEAAVIDLERPYSYYIEKGVEK